MTHPATLCAVRVSIEALGVPLDIGAVFPPKPGEERGYGIWQNRDLGLNEILGLIPRLAAQNVRGGNIFMRLGPATAKKHPGLVLLDDLSLDSVRRLSSAGFKPCLVTETSPNNFQAWVRLIDRGIVPYDTVRLVARHLAAEFGADPRAVSPRQPGRIPGFTNRKLKHQRSDGSFPYVRVVDTNPGCVASRGRDLIAGLTPDTAGRAPGAPPETPHAAKLAARSNTLITGTTATELHKFYDRAHAIIRAQVADGSRPVTASSASEADFLFARLALEAGCEAEMIAACIAIRRLDKSFNYPNATVRAAADYLNNRTLRSGSKFGW